MKGKKCIGFLILSVLVAPFLLISSDASALKYDVGKIPLYFPSGTYYGSMSLASTNAFEIEATSGLTWQNSSISQYVLGLTNDNGTCKGNGFRSFPIIIDNGDLSTYSVGFLGLEDSWHQVPNWSSVNPCLTVNRMSNYDATSVGDLAPLVGSPTRANLTDMLPYRFKYDGFYRTDTRTDSGDGVHYSNKFDLHNFFGSQGYPSKITKLKIPFAPKASVIDTLDPDTPIKFEGEFLIDLDDPSQSFGLTNSTTFQLHSYYINNNQFVESYSNCTWSLDRDNPNDPTSIYSLKYSCPTHIKSDFDSDNEVPYFRLEIEFDYSNNNTKFFQFIYESSISVTNNDYTSGGTFDSPVTGSDTHSAPGSAYQHDYSDLEPDYESSIFNLFNFGFINPFAPIFNLFTDQNSCVQIPTIAGMIHSQETQVCPWFDSTTRNIVTPVLGLSSMMLIFGFAVHWLGARSGNLFEDSVDTDNYSFRNKFGRKNK